jgi:hypothetical protein
MKLLAEMRFAGLAASDARVASLELRLGDVSRNLQEAEYKLNQKDLHARELAEVLAGVRHERDVMEQRSANFQDRFEAEARRAAQLREELTALQHQHDGDLSQLRTLMVKASVNDATLEDVRRREKDILTQRDLLAERARDAERALSEKYVYLRSEHAATQGALDVARRRCEELESVLANRGPPAPERESGVVSVNASESALLRQSISEIGAAIIRLMRPSGNGNGDGAAIRLPALAIPTVPKADTNESVAANREQATS